MTKKEKARRAIALIEELKGEVDLLPNWEKRSMSTLDRVEKIEVAYYRAIDKTIEYLQRIGENHEIKNITS